MTNTVEPIHQLRKQLYDIAQGFEGRVPHGDLVRIADRLSAVEEENKRLREALSVMRNYPGINKFCGTQICDFVDAALSNALNEGKNDGP